MYARRPGATFAGVPPDFGTDQMALEPSAARRPKKTRVEFSPSVGMLLPSFGTRVVTSNSKVAVTEASACRASWQVGALPEQAPPQPVKRACGAADAVRRTEVPGALVTLQTFAPLPQAIPPPITTPGPVTVPVRVTCGGGGGATMSKCAKTWTSPCSVTLHAPGPLQPPPQPANVEPAGLVAASETVVPSMNEAKQVAEVQSIPAGVDVTRPLPSTVTVRRRATGPVRPVSTGGELPPQAQSATIATVVNGRTGPPAFTAQLWAA